MKRPPALPTETKRLEALSDYGLGAGRPLRNLDPVVKIAARMFNMPLAAVNMIADDHVFFAASAGFEEEPNYVVSRDVSFCAHAIAEEHVMVVPDAALDERFLDNPLVTGQTGLRFYAGVPLHSPHGHALGTLCVIDTVPHYDFSHEDSERLRELAKMAAEKLELRRIEISTEKTGSAFSDATQHSPTAVIRFDENGVILDWNDSAAALFGYARVEAIGRSLDTLISEHERAALRDLLARASAARSSDGLSMPSGVHGLRKDGTGFLLGFSLFCWAANGAPTFHAHLQDLSAIHHETEELTRLAGMDVLTGLANRTRFYRYVEDALVRAPAAALLMFDLDEFKDVNKALGHATGDAILCEVARRIERILRPTDIAARVGGDEFAILLPGLSDLAQAKAVSHRAIALLAEPIFIDGCEIRVTASCGVAVAPLHAQVPMELVRDADLALCKAKSSDRGKSAEFTSALYMETLARQRHNVELRRAVSDGEFALFYQPQIRLSDGKLVGAEALIRWLHPQRGLLSPAAFLPALEQGPLAATVGRWILDEACAQAAHWRRNGQSDFRMGVNLFGVQFRVGDIASEVMSTLERHGLPPDALELEVTENIFINDDHVRRTLHLLHEQGVGIAFDDFGTSCASLSQLESYPLSRIKIHRSLIQGMSEAESDLAVVRSILELARSVELDTLAQGVGTSMQHDSLRELGCNEAQGYLYSQPVPAWNLAELHGLDHGVSFAFSQVY